MPTQPDAPRRRLAFTLGKLPAPRLRLPVIAAIAAGLAALSLIAGPVIASANSDPHRTFSAAAPFDLPASFCGFPVHIGIVANNEYQTVSVASDGSTVIKVTGRLVASVTNEVTSATVTVNASGPGITTISPDGASATYDGEGITLLFAPNATSFGLPSDLVVTSGLLQLTSDLNTGSLISMAQPPHVLEDLCAVLSS